MFIENLTSNECETLTQIIFDMEKSIYYISFKIEQCKESPHLQIDVYDWIYGNFSLLLFDKGIKLVCNNMHFINLNKIHDVYLKYMYDIFGDEYINFITN